MHHKSRVLIIGGDGFIGRNLAEYLRVKSFDITMTSRVPKKNITYDPTISLEISLSNFDIVIYCIAVSKFTECKDDPQTSSIVNTAAPTVLSKQCEALGRRFIYISSSSVFSGERPYARVQDTAKPKTVYGSQKLKAEGQIIKNRLSGIIRLSKIVETTPILKKFAQQLKIGDYIFPFDDLTFCPLGIKDVIRGIELIICSEDINTVYQLSGDEDISYYQAMCTFAKQHGINIDLVRSRSLADAAFLERLPKYGSLMTSEIFTESNIPASTSSRVLMDYLAPSK